MRKYLFLTVIFAGLMLFSPAISDSNLPEIKLIDINGKECNITKQSFSQPVVLVRYLGAVCSKCLHQLNILNQMSDTLKKMNTAVVGFSNDNSAQNIKILKAAKYKNSAVNLYSDSNSQISEKLGSTIIEINGEKTELHATLLIYKGEILFSNIDYKPFMKVGKLLEVIESIKED